MSASYYDDLDPRGRVRLWVDFTTRRGRVVEYRVVLLFDVRSGTETIRVYDSVHGYNEMHRGTRLGGKQSGTRFHSGTLGGGMRAAIKETKDGYGEMIEG